jgi:hypothetical protein
MRIARLIRLFAVAVPLLAAPLLTALPALAQFAPAPPLPSGPAQTIAPLDLTGYWVAIVNEDWRLRMTTPPRDDFSGVPLNPAGTKLAHEWDPHKDTTAKDACKYYGAPALMRIPERLHVTWADKDTLKIETDNGRQVRLLHFGDAPMPDGLSRQGFSKAEWLFHRDGFKVTSGSLKVVTTHLEPGYLRWNGVPYGSGTTLTEYFDVVTAPHGEKFLIVQSTVEDPEYLTRSTTVSPNFRQQKDDAGWHPEDCWVPRPTDAEAIGYQ